MTISSTTLPRIGVLGGMGPLASAEFMVKLVQATPAQRDQEHFPTTLDSSPQIADRPSFIDGKGPDPLPAMIEVVRRLEAAGCALITMPCNTVHHWYKQLSEQTDLPIVHIADAVAFRLRETAPHAKRVGILGARITCKLGIFSERLGPAWQWVYPTDDALKELVMPAVAAVKSGELEKGRELFLAATQELLSQNLDAIVFACTEIPVVLSQADVPLPIIDSTDALARLTVSIAQSLYQKKDAN
jgi:aspartate racemase